MKNYLDTLTQEEKAVLCSIIGGKYFKELFINNEKEFVKIKKGFRAKSLPEATALSTATVNIKHPFIFLAVNTKVDSWLREIDDNIKYLENGGSTHETALASTLIDSFFSENTMLYFKLSEQLLDDEAHARLLKNMEKVRIERAKNAEMSDRVTELEQENALLQTQLETAQQQNEAIKAEREKIINQSEQYKHTLETQLVEAQDKITILQNATFEDNHDDPEFLASFDDCDSSVLPLGNSDEIISLCEIITDYVGQKWLIRHADLSHSGHFYTFHRNEDLPPYFDNRDKIFYKDGPSDDCLYGIWNWSAVPNLNDPNKDYVISKYNTEIDPIEIITLSAVSSLDELVASLKVGIEYKPHSRRSMFAFYASNDKYVGVLCNSKEIESVNGKVSFADDFITAPVYEFTGSDIVRLNADIFFFKNAFAGIPKKLCQLKSPIDIAKSIVLNSISWTAYKTRGLTRAEYRTFKDFLTAIPVRDIVGQIQTSCRCSASVAENILNEFLDSVYKYVDGDTIEDEVILSAISVSDNLQKKTKELIKAEWEIENERLLEEAHIRLQELNSQLAQTKADLAAAQKSFEQIKSEETQILSAIAEKQKLAEDVENAIAKRIEYARLHAAEFIANMAFVGNFPKQPDISKSVSEDDAPSVPAAVQYHIVDDIQNYDNLEAHIAWSDVIDTAALELLAAGVAEPYARGLAAFLCAAFIEKQPVLLVGPNATDIVQAFSAAVSAKKYGVLNCEGDFSSRAIDMIGSKGEKIVAINNLLTGGWMNRLPEILSNKDILFIATHPYAEDIQVEPKSIYSFMLPLFTEFFVDQTATGEYVGGYFADEFNDYAPSKGVQKENKVLSHFSMNALVKKRLCNLITTMHGINPEASSDDDFLFAVLPFAYATMALDTLTEVVSDSQKGIAISTNLHRNLQYILGDA